MWLIFHGNQLHLRNHTLVALTMQDAVFQNLDEISEGISQFRSELNLYKLVGSFH
jgi:hypothetical protein